MGPLTDRLNRGLGGAHELADLAIAQFRVELDQPQDGGRPVLPLAERCIAGAAALFLALGGGVRLQLQLVVRVVLRLVDVGLLKLVVGHGIESLDPYGHIAIGDALNLQLVHAGEVRDLLEADGGVVDQPDGGRLGVQQFRHVSLLERTFPVA